MATPLGILFKSDLKTWISAKGFWLVVGAALLPTIFTGAWVVTHQKDVEVVELTWTPEIPRWNEPINFTATVVNSGPSAVPAFNATLNVTKTFRAFGSLPNQVTQEERAAEQTLIPGLAPGQRATFTLSWTPLGFYEPTGFAARTVYDYGTFVVAAFADIDDDLGELEELNNRILKGIQVGLGSLGQGPVDATLGGDPNSTTVVDASVTGLTWQPEQLHPNATVTFQATITNHGPGTLVDAVATLGVGNLTSPFPPPFANHTETLTLASGESKTIQLTWVATGLSEAITQGVPDTDRLFWVEAKVDVRNAHDASVSDNSLMSVFFVDRELVYPPPVERATIKMFYDNILELLHFIVLIPLIGLFYAAGVVADAKERGNLSYMLTRPLQRWVLPPVKFIAGFGVAALAVVISVLAAFAVLFGVGQGDVGYLVTPLLLSLVALFAYGAFFTLLGVTVERPYLVGIGLVIGWEAVAGFYVPWVKSFTLRHHIAKISDAWPRDQGIQWLPVTPEGMNELVLVLGLALGFLVAASLVMKMREFDV